LLKEKNALLRAFFRSSNVVTMADFKAVSLNAMHSSIKITDEFYSVLKDDEVKQRLSALGSNGRDKDSWDELEQFRAFLAWKKQNN
jgi:hypothetical protein